jgi:hypothetical protein
MNIPDRIKGLIKIYLKRSYRLTRLNALSAPQMIKNNNESLLDKAAIELKAALSELFPSPSYATLMALEEYMRKAADMEGLSTVSLLIDELNHPCGSCNYYREKDHDNVPDDATLEQRIKADCLKTPKLRPVKSTICRDASMLYFQTTQKSGLFQRGYRAAEY